MTTKQQPMVITEVDIPVAMEGRELSQRERAIRQLWLTCEDVVEWNGPDQLSSNEFEVCNNRLHAIEITPQGELEIYMLTTLQCSGEPDDFLKSRECECTLRDLDDLESPH